MQHGIWKEIHIYADLPTAFHCSKNLLTTILNGLSIEHLCLWTQHNMINIIHHYALADGKHGCKGGCQDGQKKGFFHYGAVGVYQVLIQTLMYSLDLLATFLQM